MHQRPIAAGSRPRNFGCACEPPSSLAQVTALPGRTLHGQGCRRREPFLRRQERVELRLQISARSKVALQEGQKGRVDSERVSDFPEGETESEATEAKSPRLFHVVNP